MLSHSPIAEKAVKGKQIKRARTSTDFSFGVSDWPEMLVFVSSGWRGYHSWEEPNKKKQWELRSENRSAGTRLLLHALPPLTDNERHRWENKEILPNI